jgi:hypothetical protein
MIRFQILFIFFLIVLFFSSCKSDDKGLSDAVMIVKGKVEGLRKGTLYLQKMKDTVLVNIDSTLVNGSPIFKFQTTLETAEVFYLYLDKEDGDSLNDRIMFFGEKGTIEINTLLKTFESSAKITGSKNQELLQEFQSFNRKFNDKNLELIKDLYLAKASKKNKLADSLQQKIDNLLRRRYLYTINFAAKNTDQNIAPFLALTQVFDANLSLLDSIAVKMSNEVSNSKYGKEFLNFIEKRRIRERVN